MQSLIADDEPDVELDQIVKPAMIEISVRAIQCCGTEAGSYLRPVDSFITQLKAQGPSRTCNESKEEEKIVKPAMIEIAVRSSSLLLSSLELSDTKVYEP